MTRPDLRLRSSVVQDERGIALILTLLLAFVVAALALGAIMIGGSASLTSRFHAQEAALQASVDGGLELARDTLNRVPTLIPEDGNVTLAAAQPVIGAGGDTIPGFSRDIYVGRSGGRAGGIGSAGQYGNNLASAISVIRNRRGAVAARRLLLTQESWSKFAVAVNEWTNAGIAYGCGEGIYGPFHSNDDLSLGGGCTSPKVQFTGEVTVAGTIRNMNSGNYTKGKTVGAARLEWPVPADLARLRQFAQESDPATFDYDVAGDPDINSRTPTVRIDFVPVDVNGNGTFEWDEGFVRIFRASAATAENRAYVNAKRWPENWDGTPYNANDDYMNMLSPNCGKIVSGEFQTAQFRFESFGGSGTPKSAKRYATVPWVKTGGPKCYLGGDPRLFATATDGDTLTPAPAATAPYGAWRARPAGRLPALDAVRPGDGVYLIPLGQNRNFKGVIYVTGSVTLSGRLRGRVTVAATGNIMLGDDVTYVTPPGTDCSETGDMLGVFSVRDVLIQDNNVQTPFRVEGAFRGRYDDTPDSENYNMFILTLQDWAGDNPGWPNSTWSGPSEGAAGGEECGGAPRGCVRVTGGITMGYVREVTYSGMKAGWAERHAYDVCGAISPPPYWPTTGRYSKNRYYEIDPVWLNEVGVADLFDILQSQ